MRVGGAVASSLVLSNGDIGGKKGRSSLEMSWAAKRWLRLRGEELSQVVACFQGMAGM